MCATKLESRHKLVMDGVIEEATLEGEVKASIPTGRVAHGFCAKNIATCDLRFYCPLALSVLKNPTENGLQTTYIKLLCTSSYLRGIANLDTQQNSASSSAR